MDSILNHYFKEEIMAKCEAYFMKYLEDEGAEKEILSNADMQLVEKQLDYLLNMVDDLLAQDEDINDAYANIVDHLVGFCILGKMNEARLCNIINKMLDEKDKD